MKTARNLTVGTYSGREADSKHKRRFDVCFSVSFNRLRALQAVFLLLWEIIEKSHIEFDRKQNKAKGSKKALFSNLSALKICAISK